MRALIGIVIVAAALWSGYWLIGSRMARQAVADALAARRADGWQAEADIGIAGFPNRFDVTLTEPRIAGPGHRIAWRAPFLQILALSYRPNEVIVVWPHRQHVETPAGTVRVESRDLRASLAVAPDADLAVRRARLVGTDVGLSDGGRVDVGELRLALRRLDGGAARYKIGAELDRVRPPGAWISDETRPAGAAHAHLDGVVTLDAPLARGTLSGAPRARALKLADLSFDWGEVELTATGRLEVTPAGYPEGELTLRAETWRALVPLAEAAGIVGADMAETAKSGLAALAGVTDDELEVPLVFREGRVKLGPVPVGPAPRLAAQRQ